MKRNPVVAIASAVVALGVLGTTSACSSGSQWAQDHDHNAPIGNYVGGASTIIQLPYHWDNVARACADGDGIYEPLNTKGYFVVIPNDPACAKH